MQTYEIELIYDIPCEIDTYENLFDEIFRRLTETEQQLFVDYYENNISLIEISKRDNINYDILKKRNVKLKAKIAKMLTIP
jgi:predicted DNA-binding protein YlxM (UPF0122 family)